MFDYMTKEDGYKPSVLSDLLGCPFCKLAVEPIEKTVCDLTIRCHPCQVSMNEPNRPKGKERLTGRWNRRAT